MFGFMQATHTHSMKVVFGGCFGGALGGWPLEKCIKLNRNGFWSAHMAAQVPSQTLLFVACVDLMPMVSNSGITEQ